MTDSSIKTPPQPPANIANFGARLAESAKPRREDLANSQCFAVSSIIVALTMLPVLVPGFFAYYKQDAIISLVDSHPQTGWLALLASLIVLGLQIFMTRRSAFRMSFEVLRKPALEVIDCMWLCRFGVAMLAIVAVTFLAVPQGEESLRTLFEHTHRYDFWYYLRAGFFHFSVILLSVGLWYSSRYLLDRFRSEYRGTSIHVNFPRILGVLGCLIPALALHQASYPYISESHPVLRVLLVLPALALFFVGPRVFPGLVLLLGLIYLGVYIANIWIVDRGGIEGLAWHSLNRAALIEFFLGGFLSVIFVAHRSFVEVQSARRGATAEMKAITPEPGEKQGPRAPQPEGLMAKAVHSIPRAWWAHGSAFLLILTVITVVPELPGVLNAAGILIFACASWISIGSMLTCFSEKPPGQNNPRARPLPIFAALISALIGFGIINDNHPLRQLNRLPAAVPIQPSLEAYMADWLATSGDRCPEMAGKPQPLILVAAEGGGIRAAYWTASVLSALQDRYPCFSSAVAGLSGVSGGSLGSSVFAAQVAHRIGLAPGAEVPECKDYDGSVKNTYLSCSRSFLGRDFLSPTLAYLLFPDLVQRFLPFPVAFFDRAAALEKSWERSWRSIFKTSDYFAAPFDSLWRGPGPAWRVPALFLNGTWAENGWRLISAPVQLGREEVSAARNVLDLSDHPIRLSTAAHVSARFTYASPAGTLIKDGRRAGHVVDGGYFENSGAATAGEILNASRRLLDSSGYRYARAADTADVVPILLVIRFQERASRNRIDLSTGAAPRPQMFLKETSVPLTTLLNTRSARGDFSLDAIRIQIARVAYLQRGAAPKAAVVEAVLNETQAPLPLGWSLSEVAQEEMAHQLEGWLERSESVRYLDRIFGYAPANEQARL